MVSNEKEERKPRRGHGIVCTLLSVKIKPGAASHVWHKFYGNTVWTVNAKNIEWLTVEFSDDLDEISGIKHKLDQLQQNSTTTEKSNHEEIISLGKLLNFRRQQQQFKIPPEQQKVMVSAKPTQLC